MSRRTASTPTTLKDRVSGILRAAGHHKAAAEQGGYRIIPGGPDGVLVYRVGEGDLREYHALLRAKFRVKPAYREPAEGVSYLLVTPLHPEARGE
jgi:hypothetical protein